MTDLPVGGAQYNQALMVGHNHETLWVPTTPSDDGDPARRRLHPPPTATARAPTGLIATHHNLTAPHLSHLSVRSKIESKTNPTSETESRPLSDEPGR